MDTLITIERYSLEKKLIWDDFIDKSRNGTFLLKRDFMDYHSDRFLDNSLIAFKGGRIHALLPANITRDKECSQSDTLVLHSHQGLTYGGWIIGDKHFEAPDMSKLFEALIRYCKDRGISEIDYKPIPHIYHHRPSMEDEYVLWNMGAEVTACGLSATIDLNSEPGFNTQQKRNLRKGERTGAVCQETDDIDRFHKLLEECLANRHNVSPVHTVEELKLLKKRFPRNIKFYICESEGEVEAGICIFECGRVWHSQYICSTERGREEGMLTLLFDKVIALSHNSDGVNYFDFGISTEDNGHYLNEGLARQKYGLGGSGTLYKSYLLRI